MNSKEDTKRGVDLSGAIMGYLIKPWNEWSETYVIANSIGMRGKTPAVRRMLRKLEAGGFVQSKASWRHNMLEWKLQSERAQPKTARSS